MSFQKEINVLQGGQVMAEFGPMRLVISASVGKIPQEEMCVRAARESFSYLERVARRKGTLGRKFSGEVEGLDDSLAVKMVRSVMTVGEDDLTPMAAVAGTIADAVADFLLNYGMTRVVVNNGGDVAVRLENGESVSVGIRTEVDKREGDHVIALGPEEPSWGIATSGLGGRSLTRGVASAVTVVAREASIADAAATAIANASFVEDGNVKQRLAEEIDPATDIPGIPVTVSVGDLGDEKKTMALSRAIKRANELLSKDIIFGAFTAINGRVAMTEFFRERMVE